MQKRRDPIAIGSVGAYTEKESNELRVVKKNLETHAREILNSYRGVDAEHIVAGFLEIISKLDGVIANYEYYGKYMRQVSDLDRDNLNMAKQRLKSVNDKPINSNQILTTLPLSELEGGATNG